MAREEPGHSFRPSIFCPFLPHIHCSPLNIIHLSHTHPFHSGQNSELSRAQNEHGKIASDSGVAAGHKAATVASAQEEQTVGQ